MSESLLCLHYQNKFIKTYIMNSTEAASFRFQDLPTEIRCRVYQIILCDFAQTARVCDTMRNPTLPLGRVHHNRVHHSVETAILRTCSSIYHEAYDVMVKSNRFVKIILGSWAAKAIVQNARLLVVTAHKDQVEKFSGYVLELNLGLEIEDYMTTEIQEFDRIMVLHRDLDRICVHLLCADAGHYASGICRDLTLAITVGHTSELTPSSKLGSLPEKYFTEKTQQLLLAPFRKLRSCQHVSINGHVSESLSKAICNELKQDEWSNPDNLSEAFRTTKETYLNLLHEGKNEEALLFSKMTFSKFNKIWATTGSGKMVNVGGMSFVSRFAGLYFSLYMNNMKIYLMTMESNAWDEYAGYAEADEAEIGAFNSISDDWWARNYTYEPSSQDLARFKCQSTRLIRIQALAENTPMEQAGDEERALTYIEEALELQPDDPLVLAEEEKIRLWIKQRKIERDSDSDSDEDE